jgi:hypothetical protein
VTVDDASPVLIVGPSIRGQLRVLAFYPPVIAVYALLTFTDYPRWISVSGVVVFGFVFLVGCLGVLRSRGSEGDLRIDVQGLTVRGQATVPWAQVRDVTVDHLLPGWRIPLIAKFSLVRFVGMPGAVFPQLPSAAWTVGRTRLRRRPPRERGRLTILTTVTNVTADQIMATVRAVAPLPAHPAPRVEP